MDDKSDVLNIDSCPPLMTVVELAEVLRVGKNTAYSLVSKRIIPSVKIGRQFRIYREDVVAFLRKSRSKSIGLSKLSKKHIRFRYTSNTLKGQKTNQIDCPAS